MHTIINSPAVVGGIVLLSLYVGGYAPLVVGILLVLLGALA